MSGVNIDIRKKRGRGRPRKPDALTTLVPVQLSASLAERLDKWATKNGIESRSGAMRALVEEGLDRAEKRAASKRGLAAEAGDAKPRGKR